MRNNLLITQKFFSHINIYHLIKSVFLDNKSKNKMISKSFTQVFPYHIYNKTDDKDKLQRL